MNRQMLRARNVKRGALLSGRTTLWVLSVLSMLEALRYWPLGFLRRLHCVHKIDTIIGDRLDLQPLFSLEVRGWDPLITRSSL